MPVYLQTALTSVIIIILIYVIAKLLDILRNLIFSVIGNIWIYLTFPGVMHHELSHALCAILTGAKVCKIVLFKPQGDTLGYVEYIPRGSFILRGIQNFLSSMGPIICGTISVYLLYTYTLPYASEAGTIWFAAAIYLMFSIVCHMSLSNIDIKNSLRGLPIIFLIIWGICLYNGFSIV